MTPFLQFQWRDKCDFLFFSLWFESFECQREGFVVPRHQKGVSSEWYKTWRRTTLRKWNRLQAPRLLRCRWKEEEAERTRPLRYYKFYRGLYDFLFSLHHSSRGRATEHVNNQKGLFFCCCLKANKKVEYEGLPRLEKAAARQSVSKEVSVTFFFSGFWPNSPVVILSRSYKKNHKTTATKKDNSAAQDWMFYLFFLLNSLIQRWLRRSFG